MNLFSNDHLNVAHQTASELLGKLPEAERLKFDLRINAGKGFLLKRSLPKNSDNFGSIGLRAMVLESAAGKPAAWSIFFFGEGDQKNQPMLSEWGENVVVETKQITDAIGRFLQQQEETLARDPMGCISRISYGVEPE